MTKNELSHKNYRDVLYTGSRMYSNMKAIRSVRHQLYTIEINKVSLSAYDDKRYLWDDGVNSYAYCHYRSNSGDRTS